MFVSVPRNARDYVPLEVKITKDLITQRGKDLTGLAEQAKLELRDLARWDIVVADST